MFDEEAEKISKLKQEMMEKQEKKKIIHEERSLQNINLTPKV